MISRGVRGGVATRVLLVEDQEESAELLRILLTRRGYEVAVARTVADAMAAAETMRFDVLVSDIGLPDGSGFDLLQWLRARGPLSAIAVSGSDRSELPTGELLSQFDEHLRKPVSVDQLVEAISRVHVPTPSPLPHTESRPTRRTTNILLVDDDEIHVTNVRRALAKGRLRDPLFSAEDGRAGLDVLRGADFPRERRLVLLDLNMPRMNGVEFLREVRADTELRSVAVIVFSTSAEKHDLVEAYDFNVAGYLVKPIGIGALVELMATLTSYWALMELP